MEKSESYNNYYKAKNRELNTNYASERGKIYGNLIGAFIGEINASLVLGLCPEPGLLNYAFSLVELASVGVIIISAIDLCLLDIDIHFQSRSFARSMCQSTKSQIYIPTIEESAQILRQYILDVGMNFPDKENCLICLDVTLPNMKLVLPPKVYEKEARSILQDVELLAYSAAQEYYAQKGR